MKYLLTLDTYAHSKENTFYHAIHSTIKACKQDLEYLILNKNITMEHNGTPQHKIYRATISKKMNTGNWEIIKATHDGIKWDKINAIENGDIFSKSLVAYGKSFNDILKGEH